MDRAHRSAPGKSRLQSPSVGLQKAQGGNREWRFRVGDYRVVYTINDTELLVEVTRIRHRSEVYER